MHHRRIFALVSSVFSIYVLSHLCLSCGVGDADSDEYWEISNYLEYNDLREEYYSLSVENQTALRNYYKETKGVKSFDSVVRAAKKFKQPVEYISALIPIGKFFTLSDAEYTKLFNLFPEPLQLKVLSRQDPSVVVSLLSIKSAPQISDIAWLKALCDLLETVDQPELRLKVIEKFYPTTVLKLLKELHAKDLEAVVNSWDSTISEHKLRFLTELPNKGDWTAKEFLVECMGRGANFSPLQVDKLLSIGSISSTQKELVLGLATVPGIGQLDERSFEVLMNFQISEYTADNPRYVAVLATELLNNRQLDDDKKGILINMKGPAIEFIVNLFPRYTLFTTGEFKIIAEKLNEKAILDSIKSKIGDKSYRARVKMLFEHWETHIMGTKTYTNDTDMKDDVRISLT